MATNYDRGRQTEYKAIEYLEKVGYNAIRSAGSHGVFDVIAWNGVSTRFIQVKRCKDKLDNFEAEKEEIRNSITPANSIKEIWIWLDKKGFIKQEVVE